MEIDGIPIPKDYKSPLEERGETEEDATPHLIPTRNAFKSYVAESPRPANAYVYGRFIWGSQHVVGEGRHLVRILLTDLFAPQSPAILKAEYEDRYSTSSFSVNKDLMTGTIWVPDATPLKLPICGQKVKVLRFTDPKLFRGECYQFTTRFQDLEFAKPMDATLVDGAEVGGSINQTSSDVSPATKLSSAAGASNDTIPIKIENATKKRKLK